MQAFAAFMLSWTGFISAVAMLRVVINIAFHRMRSPLFCLIKIYKRLSNNQGEQQFNQAGQTGIYNKMAAYR